MDARWWAVLSLIWLLALSAGVGLAAAVLARARLRRVIDGVLGGYS